MNRLLPLVILTALVGCTPDAAEQHSNSGQRGPTQVNFFGKPPSPKEPRITVTGAAFSPEGNRLLVTFEKSSYPPTAKLVLYEIPSGKRLWVTEVSEPLYPVAVLPGAKTGLIYRGPSLELWDLEHGKLEKVILR